MTRVHIDTTATRGCVFPGCTDTGAVFRHHKGNDGLLGRFCRNISRTYYDYLDCADVCDTHHMQVHFNYNLWMKVHKIRTFGMTTGDLIELRTKFILLFEDYLSGRVKMKKVNKKFQRQWISSRKKWQKRQVKLRSSRTKGK